LPRHPLSDLTALAEEANRRTEDGDPKGGLALAGRAVQLADADGRLGARAAAQRALGHAWYGLGDYRAAKIAGERARALDAQADPDGPAVGEDDDLIGVSILQLGDAVAAVTLLRSASARLEAARGPGHETTIRALGNLAAALAHAGDDRAAEVTGRDALARAERTLGTHRQTAVILNGLAVRAGRVPERAAEALSLSERALDVARASVLAGHPLVVSLAANVAIGRARAGDLTAVGLLREAVAAHESAYGPDHPSIAFVLAALSDATDDPAEARRAIARATLIRLRSLGPGARPTLDALRRAVHWFAPRAPGEPVSPEATEIYRDWAALDPDAAPVALPTVRRRSPEEAGARLAETFERFLGDVPMPDEVRAAVTAAYAEADEAAADGAYSSSIRSLERAIQTIESVKGMATPDLIEPLRRLGAICLAAGAEDRLLEIRRRIADLAETAYGPGHPLATMAITSYAEQERREFGGLSEATAERVGAAVRATFADEARSVRLAERAFAAVPARERRVIPLSVARVEALGTIRAEGPLAGLDAIDWAGIGHAYGPARDTPDDIRLLRAADPDLRDDALERLANSICHQGSVYPASAEVVPFLARLALDPTQPDRPGIIWLLAMLAHGANDPSTDATVGGAIRDAIAPYAAALLASADTAVDLGGAVAALAGAMQPDEGGGRDA
jgi:tetratricopeptide (TPR) repeat protein